METYKIIIVTILCFFVTSAFSQQYTPMTAAGYQMKRIKADSTLHIPSFCGVPILRNSTAKEGAIAMDTCNNKLYKWTNASGWSEVAGGGTGGTQDLSSVLIEGNKGYKNIEILTTTGSDNSIIISAEDNGGLPEFSLNDSIGQSIVLQTQTKYDLPAITFQKNDNYQTLLFNDSSFGSVYLPNQRYDLPNTMEDTLATLRDIREGGGNGGGGTVTSVATGYGLSGGTITTSGTIVVDSATLSNKYLRILDTTNKWVNNITRESGKDSIFYYIGGNKYAIKDSLGGSNGRFGNDTATIVMAKVHNDAGVQLTNGKVVYLGTSGTSSDAPSVRLANNKGDSSSANTFGFVSGTINVNDTGWVIISGKIEKLNTSAFANGDIIYLDSISGNWTKTKPVAPYHMVYLGVVVKANAGNGSIFVKCQNGYEMDEIHDVQISGKVNNNILVYSDTQKVWKNRSVYEIVDTTSLSSRINLKANQSQSRYSFLANNTNSTANMSTTPFYDAGSQTYSSTITWGAGAPSGTTNHSYRWTQTGKVVNLQIVLVYGTASSSAQTTVIMALPSDVPNPIVPSGMSATNGDMLYFGTGNFYQTINTVPTTAGFVALRGNASGGYEVVLTRAASLASTRYVNASVQYFTNTTY